MFSLRNERPQTMPEERGKQLRYQHEATGRHAQRNGYFVGQGEATKDQLLVVSAHEQR